jgi:hypothetical protein
MVRRALVPTEANLVPDYILAVKGWLLISTDAKA